MMLASRCDLVVVIDGFEFIRFVLLFWRCSGSLLDIWSGVVSEL